MKFMTISTSKFSVHRVSPAVKDHTEVCRWQQNANIADGDLEPSQMASLSATGKVLGRAGIRFAWRFSCIPVTPDSIHCHSSGL